MRFIMQGMEDADRQLGANIDDLSYMTIHRREVGKRDEERLGRFNFTLHDARRVLNLPDPYQVCGEGEDEPEAESDASDADQGRRMLLAAARRFIRLTLARASVNVRILRYRIRAYGPKADAPSPVNLTINVEDCRVKSEPFNDDPLMDTPDDEPVEVLPRRAAEPVQAFTQMPSQLDPTAIVSPSGQAMRELGLCYADFAHFLLGSMSRVQALNDGMHSRLGHELSQSRHQVDTLAAAVLDHRVQQLEIAERAVEGDRNARHRSDLAAQAVKELGDAAKTFLGGGAAPGLPPQLLSSIAPLLQHPELRALLSDPTVLGLLRDPRFLGDLAAMLRNVAAQAKAAQAAQQAAQNGAQPPPPSAPPA